VPNAASAGEAAAASVAAEAVIKKSLRFSFFMAREIVADGATNAPVSRRFNAR
jgi:hypothetical protein